MKPLLPGAAFSSSTFAKSRIEKLEAEKLAASGLKPLPPPASDLLPFERGLKKVPEGPPQKIAALGNRWTAGDFHRKTSFSSIYACELRSSTISHSCLQLSQWNDSRTSYTFTITCRYWKDGLFRSGLDSTRCWTSPIRFELVRSPAR